jgi:hypothetical protein
VDGECQFPYWTDPTSGLMWENPPNAGAEDWTDAHSYCWYLDIGGYSDWEVPTISELRTLIRGCPETVTGGACGVTDSCLSSSCEDDGVCWSCSASEGPADGCYWPDEMQGPCSVYWSSSTQLDSQTDAWRVLFYNGGVDNQYKDDWNGVRCVR